MGLGDEIMALGRAERVYEQTGKQVAICNDFGAPREHAAWIGNPAWNRNGPEQIIDGAGARPYIKSFDGRKTIFNLDYRPRAGRVYLTDEERATCTIEGVFAVVSPVLKDRASPNKSWGIERWEAVIADFPVPVYQLCESDKIEVIRGAIPYRTPSFRAALAVIERAALVLTNEGGAHHMAASAGVPAVVIFGGFTPPDVTGYEIHHNLGLENPDDYCGMWVPCEHCQNALGQITPEMVKEKARLILESINE